MTETNSGAQHRALLAKALLELQKSQARIQALEQLVDNAVPAPIHKEPIAIIGIGCRFPGGADRPEKLWQLLKSGRNLVSDIPVERWDMDHFYDEKVGVAGKIYTRKGYFLDDVSHFDRSFFSISPAEAQELDPQHRLLMECTWEALEWAGYDPLKLRGSNTGVFIGAMNADYAQYSLLALGQASMYTAVANGNGMGAGRLAHNFGFQGPTLAIDTLCSSSLVSTHLAKNSLQNGECDLAVVGGVNLLLTPGMFVVTSAANMLAADGLCKTFDHSADGYARGEACGVIVLKRLSDARRDNDNILAMICGSAINQDGPSSALPVPNGLAQEDVIRRALKDAQLDSTAIDYIEVHGTGTALGDPIEVEALAKVFTSPRSEKLKVGSIKTNFGHTEGAAGIAGLIKVVLAMQEATIPAHLNVTHLSERIDWDNVDIDVCTKAQPWPRRAEHYFAGVSAFGIGGTNAHVILKSAEVPDTPLVQRGGVMVTLSAKTAPALREMLKEHLAWIHHNPHELARYGYTSNISRSSFSHRVGFCVDSLAALTDSLSALVDNDEMPPPMALAQKPAFIFTGQLTRQQQVTLVRQLQPIAAFHKALEKFAPAFRQISQHDLAAILTEDTIAGLSTENSLILGIVLELALAESLLVLGVIPGIVMGFGLGEYVAAAFAGVISVSTLCAIANAEQQQCQQQLEASITLLEVKTELRNIRALLREQSGFEGRQAVVAINGAQDVWLAVADSCLENMQQVLKSRDIAFTSLGQASHHQRRGLLQDTGFLAPLLAQEPLQRPRYTMLSTITGQQVQSEIATTEYWLRQLNSVTKVKSVADTLAATGVETVVQTAGNSIQSRPLSSMLRGGDAGTIIHWFSLLEEVGTTEQRLESFLIQQWQQGFSINWAAYYQGSGLCALPLPSYPFQREHCWLEHSGDWLNTGLVNNRQTQLGIRDEWGSTKQDLALSIRTHVASIKGLSPDEVLPEHHFQLHLGYDSMSIMELRSLLEKNIWLKERIELKQMMMISTVAELIEFIILRVSSDPESLIRA